MPDLVEQYPLGSARGNSCISCGAAQRQVMDPDRTVRAERLVWLHNSDWEGHIVLCESCALTIGRLLGMVDEATATAHREAIDELTTKLDAAIADAEAANALVERLRFYDQAHAANPAPVTVTGAAPEPVPEPVPAAKPKARKKTAA